MPETFESPFVFVRLCIELKVCLSKQRLFYRQIEKSRLFNWEFPLKGVVFLRLEAFILLFLDVLFLDYGSNPTSNTLKI